ncbi:MAG TPA: hypothetical protein VHE83_09265 [Mycobacteriales bacterium]|nr:hypothetical protein [Mycobacteriales bacterium]
MAGPPAGEVALLVVLGLGYAGGLTAMWHNAARRQPAWIVRRLYRTQRPVNVVVNALSVSAWDPSSPGGRGSFYAWGTATYALDDPTTIRVRFEPRSGPLIERSATIPPELLPDSPAIRHRRRVARAVMAAYAVAALGAFSVTASLTGGTASRRARLGALAAIGAFLVAWLITHLTVIRARRRAAAATKAEVRPHHVLAWTGLLIAISAALGVAWHLQNLDTTHPISWPSAFVTAAIFTLVSAATIALSLHHHSYIHHADDHRSPPPGR